MAKLLSLLLCLGLMYYCRLSNAAVVEDHSAQLMEPPSEPASRDVRQTSTFYNILVSTNGQFVAVYLDTIRLQLVLDPPILSAIEPRSNYATIFTLEAGSNFNFIIKNYVVPQVGPTLTRTGQTTYSIVMQGIDDPVEFSISVCRSRTDRQSICGTDNDGQTVCWVPVDESSPNPLRRQLVKAERVASDSAEACVFLLRRISSSIPPPL